MPESLLRNALVDLGQDALDDRQVIDLASTFKVSEQAMTIRLTTIGLL
jgi:Zn-dependent peptidase ImmA (M78 family)